MPAEDLPDLRGHVVRDALEARVLQDGDLLVVHPKGAGANRRVAVVQGGEVVSLVTALPLASAGWVICRAVRGLDITVRPDPD